MRNVLRVLLLAPILLSAGCCANDTCNCDDLFADSLYFGFDTSSANAFTSADIDTVYLLRYTTSLQRPSDSAAIIRAQNYSRPRLLRARLKTFGLDSTTLVLSDNYPFAPGSKGKLSQYVYKIRVRLGNSRKNPYVDYSLNSIASAGKYNADGCCTCYENTQKAAFINGQYTDFTEIMARPIVLTLTK
ncbi:MAG: hypothetical protein ACRYFX_07750 [Janthinobacterium lividum]